MNPNFMPDISADYYSNCVGTNKTDEIANFGRAHCDSPQLLVERLMQKMAADNPDLEVILIPGDIVTHGFS